MLPKKDKHILIIRDQREIHLLQDAVARNTFKTKYLAIANHFCD